MSPEPPSLGQDQHDARADRADRRLASVQLERLDQRGGESTGRSQRVTGQKRRWR